MSQDKTAERNKLVTRSPHLQISRSKYQAPVASSPPEVDASSRYGFSGHETFPFRYTWLPKGIQKLQVYPDLFSRDDAVVTLGVGKNMVKSIRHWCETLSLIEPTEGSNGLRPTRLGRALFGADGWDPYLEDPGTLWLLHWLLVSRRDRASTWYLAFTRFNTNPFKRDQLVNWLVSRISQTMGVRATASSIRRDVEVFLRTYVAARSTRDAILEDSFDCPLVELGLVKEIEHELYQFVRGPKPALADLIFVYALLDFWQFVAPQQQTLSFEMILHGAASPGAAFKLSENALVERLEQLPSWTRLLYDDTAGRRIVLRRDQLIDPITALTNYYVAPSLELTQ